jgi:hypothetical protein
MSQDSFSESSGRGWLEKLGGAFKGVLVGIVLFIAAFPVLFVNEGDAVDRFKGLKEGAGVVVSVSADKVDPANEGRMVYVSGTAVTKDMLADSDFGLSISGSKLERSAEVFQWVENKKSETKKKLGGGEETVTEYTYEKTWKEGVSDSSKFKIRDGHLNPSTTGYAAKKISAQNVALGSFSLNTVQIDRLGKSEEVQSDVLSSAAAVKAGKFKVSGNYIYAGKDPAVPQIGDCRVKYALAIPGDVSIIAKQTGNTFAPFKTEHTTIDLLKNEKLTSDEMFAAAKSERETITWIIRLLGFVMMFVGLILILKPLSAIMDVVPILGSIASGIAGVVAFFIALGFAVITIAIAWIFFRPLLGIPLLVVGVGAIVGAKYMSNKKKQNA